MIFFRSQKTIIISILLLSTTFCFAQRVIPKELHGFWQFQVAKKGDWNGMLINDTYVELWYDLAKLQKITKTEKGYMLEVDNLNKLDTVQVELLPNDSAVFTMYNKTYRCKRYTSDPDIEIYPEEQYVDLFSEKWYKRVSDTPQPLLWKDGKFQLDGKMWTIIWFGKYLNREYRSLVENNGEYNLMYISHFKAEKRCRFTYNQKPTMFTTNVTEDNSLYLGAKQVFFADSLTENVENISVDFEVRNNIPKNIKVCVSPIFPVLNNVGVQAAVSSQTERIVKKIVKGDTICDSGGLLSRFGIVDASFAKTTKGGVKFSGDHDGAKYITVRNRIKWDKGMYRVRLFKSGYTDGKPLPFDSIRWNRNYMPGEYEHTWITMTFEDLKSGKKWTIGSVAIPGKNIKMGNNLWLFVEIYGTPINFIGKDNNIHTTGVFYKDIPTLKVVYQNFQMNGKKVYFEKISPAGDNDPSKKLGRSVGDTEKGNVEFKIGYKE